MVNVIFCGFGEDMDRRVHARTGDLLMRVAESNGIQLSSDNKYAVMIEDLSIDEAMNATEEDYDAHAQSYYMEDSELETLVSMGAISQKEADVAQQYNRQTAVRLADQCVVRSDILVKPYKK